MNTADQTNVVLQNTVLTKLMAQVARGLAELETTVLSEQQRSIVDFMLKSTSDSRTLLGGTVADPPSYKRFVEEGATRFQSIAELKSFLKSIEPSKDALLPVSLVRFRKRKTQDDESFAVVLDGVHMVQDDSLHQSSLNAQMILLLMFRAKPQGVFLQGAFPITEQAMENFSTKHKALGDMPFYQALSGGNCEMKMTPQQQSIKLSSKLVCHSPSCVLQVLQPGAMQKLSKPEEQASRQLLLTLSLHLKNRYRTSDSLCHDFSEAE